jgi:uncharacterized protein YdaU (DUF1376 family)
MHYFQFEIKEWMANTAHLTEQEEAYYLRLILYYYDSEQAIPLDPTPVFRKLRIKDFEVGMALLREFFVEIDIGWDHNRCNQEIHKYQAKIEQASKAGKASAERRLNTRSTPVQPITNHKSIIKNQESNNTRVIVGFDDFWNTYDKKVGKPNAQKEWAKANIDNILLKTVLEQAKKYAQTTEKKFRKDPERWIKYRGWEDEIIVIDQSKAKELPLGSDKQIEEAYRIECGGDPAKARFNSYFDMKKFILDQREKRSRA